MSDKRETGRPSDFCQEMADRICEQLADGESLRKICAADDMPNRSTVFRWLGVHALFRDQYARAREAQADALFDEAIDIADDGRNDWMEALDSEGKPAGWKVNGEHIQRSRLRIDARKWMAGKLRPKVYGDKVINEVSGPDGRPIEVAEQKPRREVAKMILALIHQAAAEEPENPVALPVERESND